MVADIQKDDHFVSFVEPYDADIHVDTALKQVAGSLDALGTQRRVGWILRQKKQLLFQLFFLLVGQFFKTFLETRG